MPAHVDTFMEQIAFPPDQLPIPSPGAGESPRIGVYYKTHGFPPAPYHSRNDPV